jgi:hypothetical protein
MWYIVVSSDLSGKETKVRAGALLSTSGTQEHPRVKPIDLSTINTRDQPSLFKVIV